MPDSGCLRIRTLLFRKTQTLFRRLPNFSKHYTSSACIFFSKKWKSDLLAFQRTFILCYGKNSWDLTAVSGFRHHRDCCRDFHDCFLRSSCAWVLLRDLFSLLTICLERWKKKVSSIVFPLFLQRPFFLQRLKTTFICLLSQGPRFLRIFLFFRNNRQSSIISLAKIETKRKRVFLRWICDQSSTTNYISQLIREGVCFGRRGCTALKSLWDLLWKICLKLMDSASVNIPKDRELFRRYKSFPCHDYRPGRLSISKEIHRNINVWAGEFVTPSFAYFCDQTVERRISKRTRVMYTSTQKLNTPWVSNVLSLMKHAWMFIFPRLDQFSSFVGNKTMIASFVYRREIFRGSSNSSRISD